MTGFERAELLRDFLNGQSQYFEEKYCTLDKERRKLNSRYKIKGTEFDIYVEHVTVFRVLIFSDNSVFLVVPFLSFFEKCSDALKQLLIFNFDLFVDAI
jgi:hypothetical protein